MFYPIEKAKGLNDLKDTSIVTPVNGDTLVFDGEKWENSQDVWKTMSKNGVHNYLKFPTLAELKVMNTTGTWSNNVYTFNGVTYTVDEKNCTVTVNSDGTGSSSGTYLSLYNRIGSRYYVKNNDYKVNGLDNGNASSFYIEVVATTKGATSQAWSVKGIDKEGASFTYDDTQIDGLGVTLFAMANYAIDHVVIKPQIRLAIDRYTDFEPYVTPIPELWSKEQQKKNGSYNLCPNDLISQVEAGITYQTLSDKTIQASGTASGSSSIWMTKNIKLKKGTYKICGTPSGGNYNTGYALYVVVGTTTIATDTPNTLGLKDIFTVTDESTIYNIGIVVRSGVTAPSALFKPMITTDLNATYADYVPHAKTNRELTEDVTTKKGSLSPSQYTTSAENVKVRQVGNSVHIWGFCNNNIQHSDGSNNNVLGTITGVTVPKTDEAVRTVCGIAAHAYDIPQQVGYLSLATNGELIFKTTQTGTKSVYFDISYAV